MIACPDCGSENIEGADLCEQCGQPLQAPSSATEIEQRIVEDRIEILAPKPVVAVAPETSVGEVLKTLVARSIGCVVVEQAGKIVGIFSERDALMRLNTDAASLLDCPISQFMTPSPETLKASDKIAFALHKMDLGGYRHIPIVENGRAAGIISIRDILRYMTEHLAAPAS